MIDFYFNFNPWRKETIYDDHGGHYPVCTNYYCTFTVNGVSFSARFSDIGRLISIECPKTYEHIIYIEGLKSVDTDVATNLIKKSFTNNKTLQKFMAKHNVDVISSIKPFDLGYEWD